MKPTPSSRPVMYLTQFNDFLIITGDTLLHFLASVGLTHPTYPDYFQPTRLISINKHAPFFKLLTRLSLHRLLYVIMELLSTNNLLHNKQHVQLTRPWRHILSRKRLTHKKRLTWPSPRTSKSKPVRPKPPCPQFFSHIIHSPPVVFPLIPHVVHVYGHSPLLLFPRAGVG